MIVAVNKRRCCLLAISALIIAAAPVARAAQLTLPPHANGTWSFTYTGNQMLINFAANPATVNCGRIGLVQTAKISFDGTVIKRPSSIHLPWAYRDDDVVVDGTFVDHIFCEEDPFYNGQDVPQDFGAATATLATMSDGPQIPDGSFPPGAKNVKIHFEVCAICMAGPDRGTVYGSVLWWLERKRGEKTPSGQMSWGKATPKSKAVADDASPSFKKALERFKSTHTKDNQSHCPEDLPAGDCGNRFSGRRMPLHFHVNDDYRVVRVGTGVMKGNSLTGLPPPTHPIAVNIGSLLVSCDYVLVPKGETIVISRNSDLEEADPDIPFRATFVDLLEGGLQTVETGTCLAAEHCGVRAIDAFDNTLAAVAPVDTNDPDTIIMYNADFDRQKGLVTFRNHPLSSHSILAVNVREGGRVSEIGPGQSVTYKFPSLARRLQRILWRALIPRASCR